MIIYKDLFTGDELFSDTYPMRLVDDIFYEVDGKIVTETSDISDAAIGANASAEGPADDEGATAASVSGCNIVIANRLVETGFSKKKEYGVHLKAYCAKIRDHLEKEDPVRHAIFKEKAQKAVKKVLDFFSDLQFFVGEGMDPDGMHVLMMYRDDQVTPYMLFFKDGLIEEKV